MPEAMYSRRSRDFIDSLSAEDFETASIRSAAPSYSSETPSSHYTVPHAALPSLPPYAAPPSGGAGRHQSAPSLSAATASPSAASRRTASASAASGSMGGAVFSTPNSLASGRRNDMPNLSQFRIPTWSNVSSNPASRHYHAVALRRAAAAEHASAAAEIGGLMRRLAIIDRMEQEEAAAASRRTAAANGRASSSSNNNVVRPLEDPYLVGEVAARRARSDRLARAREARHSGDDPLVREDRRWDWFLGQMKGRQGLSWNPQPRFRRQFDLTILSPATVRHIHARHV